eukprot:scaffold303420_cov16-Prasinocladus_malaysianus.AAC.1
MSLWLPKIQFFVVDNSALNEFGAYQWMTSCGHPLPRRPPSLPDAWDSPSPACTARLPGGGMPAQHKQIWKSISQPSEAAVRHTLTSNQANQI